MSIKTWSTGEVLTASDVNTYLMRQVIITCTSSTRPSSPVEGMHIWETDTLKGYVYDSSAWQFKEASVASLFIRKTLDETISNSTTDQADDQLSVTVPAYSRWLMELFIIYSSSTSADFHIITNPGWSDWASYGPAAGETNKDSSLVNPKCFVVPGGIGGYGSDACVRARGIMIYNNSASPQTTTLLWAQLVAEVSNTTVKAGSYMFLRLVDD
jgi:hypothetical protein